MFIGPGEATVIELHGWDEGGDDHHKKEVRRLLCAVIQGGLEETCWYGGRDIVMAAEYTPYGCATAVCAAPMLSRRPLRRAVVRRALPRARVSPAY